MRSYSRNENEKSKLQIPPPQNPKCMTIREKGINYFKLSAYWTHSILQGYIVNQICLVWKYMLFLLLRERQGIKHHLFLDFEQSTESSVSKWIWRPII